MKTRSLLFRLLIYACGLFTLGILAGIVLFILVKGLPHLSLDFLFAEYNSKTLSLLSPLVTTLAMILLSLLITVPFGLFTAIYLNEYAKSGSKLVWLINLATETLAAIPSIVYGLFGMIFFVGVLRLRTSVLAGALTMSIMILPLIIRTAQEALKSVPALYREGSFGLGAGKLATIFRVVLPSAVPGILSGVILAIGRIVGESAALIFTSGTNIGDVTLNLMESRRTLAIHMYMLASEGLPHSRNKAFATGAILIFIVLIVNALAARLAKKLGGTHES